MESIQQIHIQLKSRNGDIFLVDPAILEYSGVLQARLDELWASEKGDNVIMVPEGDSNLLKMIIDWLRSRKEDQCSIPPSPEIAIADSSSTIAANQEHEDLNDGRIPGIGQWEADYFNGNKGSIFTLLAVANRLEVATLLKDAGWALLKWCRNKSLDETYETFGIRNPTEKTNRGGESAGPGPESTAIPENAEADECDRNTMPQHDVEIENIDETPKTDDDTMPAGAEKAKDGESPESDAYDAEMISLRLNPIVLISCFSCLLLQAALVVGAGHDPPPNRPTQLDDIERDTLNSERQVFKKEAIAQQQQQQQQHGASSSQSNNHYSLQIQHHPGSTAAAHSSVKYVTPLPAPTQITYPAKDHHLAPQHYFHQQQQQQQQPVQQLQYQPHQLHQHQQLHHQPVPQVHEDHSTYTVPSRQSLLQPVIGGSAPTSPYLTPQPQYVYVQARPQQLAAVTSPGQGLPQSLLHILPQNSQAYIMIPTPAYYHQQQQQQQQQQPAHLPSSGAPTQAPHSAQQLAAYANDPDNHIETYSHGETGAQSPSAPVPSPSLPSLPPQVPQATTPTPDIVYAPSASTPVPPHRHQSPSSEFSIVKSIEQPIYYSHDLPPAPLPSPAYSNKDFPQHSFVAPYHQRPTHLQPYHPHHEPHGPQYPTFVPGSYPQHLAPAPSPLYPSLSHPNNGILNYFGVQQRPPTSLLDSYVPSALQVHKGPPVFVPKVQHRPAPPPVSFYPTGYPFLTGPAAPHQLHHHQPHHAFPVNHLHTTVLQPAASATTLAGHHGHQVLPAYNYNTIAYSVPLAFTKTSAQYKRSPALFSVAGFVPRLPLAMATTKLQPAAKLP
ncbi:uncharacterized protein LOC128274984 [Anopheles cruzii]|uniref:uncharacterized protein LOC128274984 n=1 Tax=Anopheles cruzii TaxID=68878 RepID=UPI0022EC452B|nr:uncharacterized protein LOC128274984 [Anopheles cruzii]